MRDEQHSYFIFTGRCKEDPIWEARHIEWPLPSTPFSDSNLNSNLTEEAAECPPLRLGRISHVFSWRGRSETPVKYN